VDQPVAPPQLWIDNGMQWLSSVFAWLWAAWLALWNGFLSKLARFVSVAGVLTWLLLPPKHQLKEFITNGATEFLSIDYYLREAHGAGEIGGDLEALVDGIRDDPTTSYRNVHLFSYSFGCIVAINALFRRGEPLLASKALTTVDSMVTIGCPFDMVRLVRPTYFCERTVPEGWTEEHPTPRQWINVYAPTDILGSNFRNDGEIGEASDDVMAQATGNQLPTPLNQAFSPGGAPVEGNFISMLALSGFRVHRMYWDLGVTDEDTCFDRLIGELYRDDPFLASPAPAS
jgi:hypothetical protein